MNWRELRPYDDAKEALEALCDLAEGRGIDTDREREAILKVINAAREAEVIIK